MTNEKIGFIVDSSLGVLDDNINRDLVKQVYFNVLDSENNEYLDDNKCLPTETIINKLKNKVIFKTSAVSPGMVITAIEELLENVDKVILFTVSSGLSSLYNNVKFLEEEYKDKFFVVDTNEIGYGIKYMFNKAYEMAMDGKSAKDIIEFSRNYYRNNFTSFTCESWEPLSNSGRAPKLLSKFMNTIQSRPVIYFYKKNRLGGIAIGKNEKCYQKAIDKMFELFSKIFPNTNKDDIEHIVFYDNEVEVKKSQYIVENISKKFGVAKEKIVSSFAPNLVLIYTGVGSFGVHIRCKKEATNRE